LDCKQRTLAGMCATSHFQGAALQTRLRPRLYVEVLPSGSIVWRYRYRLNGKREKPTLDKLPSPHPEERTPEAGRRGASGGAGPVSGTEKQQEKVAGAEDTTVVADFAERFFKDIQSRDRKDVTMPRR